VLRGPGWLRPEERLISNESWAVERWARRMKREAPGPAGMRLRGGPDGLRAAAPAAEAGAEAAPERYEHERPGSLLHIDARRFALIEGIGHTI